MPTVLRIEDALDALDGPELGADDRLTEPCGMAELIARVRASLRRASQVHEILASDDGQSMKGTREPTPI